MAKIRIAIAGLGNCASSLIQGLGYYRDERNRADGLTYPDIRGYGPGDIELVAAFDVDARKVGRDIAEALFSGPNCCRTFCGKIPAGTVKKAKVKMGRALDGISPHMKKYQQDETFKLSNQRPCDVVSALRQSKADMLLNYLPVGSQKATRFYAECCLEAGVAFINNIPVFIASDASWRKRFEARNLPLIGDDVKSQLGATILHRALVRLFRERGVAVKGTYQLNIGGNTDFLNMLNPERLNFKKISKTAAVQSEMGAPLDGSKIHIEPSGYVRWLKDRKECFIRIEGAGFAGAPVKLEVKLAVEDSYNSAGVVIDAIRCCKLALDRKTGGALTSISAYAMKHPPVQCADWQAKINLEKYMAGKLER